MITFLVLVTILRTVEQPITISEEATNQDG